MAPTDIPAFALSQLSLLSEELKAETDETGLLTATHAPSTLARAGLAVLNLAVASQRTGLGGKTLLELSVDNAVAGDKKELPEHGLRVGDIVGVSEQPKGAERKKVREEMEQKMVQGVVVRLVKDVLVVALDKDEVDIPVGRLWMCVTSQNMWHMRVWLICYVYIASSLQMMLPTRGTFLPSISYNGAQDAG